LCWNGNLTESNVAFYLLHGGHQFFVVQSSQLRWKKMAREKRKKRKRSDGKTRG